MINKGLSALVRSLRRQPGTGENLQKENPAAPRVEGSGMSLTIPAGRLAGSIQCLNCGTPLEGPFCYYCGQPDKNFMRFFPVLLREFLEDFLELDSRFMRTMKPLLFLPGKLTRDYLDGRRFRYTPPIRLYIFSSMAFFILAAALAGNAINIDGQDLAESGIGPVLSVESAHSGKPEDDTDVISFNDEPWDKETNPLIIPLMPDFVNDWVNDEIEESPQKGKEIAANPGLIIDKAIDVLPATMFVLLPLAALLLKFWYLFASKYYIEHLILALHNHSFLFVLFLLSMILNSLAGWAEPTGEGRITIAVDWIGSAILMWIPVYFLFSLKRVYRQGWSLTITKFLVVSFSYMILLGLTISVVALLSFVLL